MLYIRPRSYLLVLLSIALMACADQSGQPSEPKPTPETITSQTADMVVINGDVYTSDINIARTQAFAIKDGRFLAVGSSDEILGLTDTDTKIIDANGHTVVPGLIDAHSHVSGNAPEVAGVDLSYIVDKAEWLELIIDADRRLPKGEWMTGGYWDHTLSDGEFPTKEMLDAVVPDRPIQLNHIDGHFSWVNSLALQMANVDAQTPVPPGGEIVVDDETGEPTGILLEGAQSLVVNIIPLRNDVQRRDGLQKMQRYANSLGVTGLHQMGSLEDYLYIVEQAQPTLRVWYGMVWPRQGDGSIADVVQGILETQTEVNDRVEKSGNSAGLGPILELGFVKLLNDGVLSAHTAVLSEDYSDREGWSGEYITPPVKLNTLVQDLTAAGLPVAIHSIGDAAVSASLDAFEAAQDNVVPTPNRVEHIEVAHTEDIQRFKDLGVVASMQPNHATNAIGYVPTRLGEVRENRAYVWRSMRDNGVKLVFGADYPTSPLSPLVQIGDAMFRKSPFGFNDGASWHPEQALSFEEALLAYTRDSADITAWKDEVGTITKGKWADFVILDGKVPDPMNESFLDLSVESTFLAGDEVYNKDK